MATLKNVAIYYFVKMNYLAKIYFITIISFLISQVDLLSQRESYNWFVGNNSGISFKEKGERLVEFKTKSIGRYSCGSISDAKGNLLLYANSSFVLNYLHDTLDIMTKYDNTGSGRIATIIPRPYHDNQYYLFYSPTESVLSKDIRYSIINMNENQGYGLVIQKGINLISGMADPLKLSAVYHKNKKDIWLVSHDWDSTGYRVFLIDSFGIHFKHYFFLGNSIQRFSEFDINGNPADFCSNIGQMKFSPDGTKIAFLSHPECGWNQTNYGFIQICDFNDSTGLISNPKSIWLEFTYDDDAVDDVLQQPMSGLEFSPNSKFIYAFCRQFDLTHDITKYTKDSSYRFYPKDSKNLITGLNYQLGPDGNIYILGSKIYTIKNPNEKGVKCELDSLYCSINTLSCRLPQFITSWFKFEIEAESNSEVCEGDEMELYATDRMNARYTWTGPNGFSSTEQNPVVPNAKPEMSGWYYVTAERRHDEISSDSVFVIVNPKPQFKIEPKDTVFICQFGKANLSSNILNDNFTFLWSTGETSSSITVDTAGKYYLTVTNEFGCQSTDSVVVVYQYIQPEIEIIGNVPACDGDTIILRTKDKYDVYNWSTGDTTSEIVLTKSARCSVSVVDSLGCTGTSDEVDVLFYPTPKTKIKGPDTVCVGSTVTYWVNKNLTSGYYWGVELGSLIPGVTEDTVNVKWLKAGRGKIISHQTSLNGCVGKDSMYVEIIDEVKSKIIPNNPIICGNGTVTLKTSEQYESYEWSTGETTDSIIVNSSGEYFVRVTATGGCTGSDTVSVKKGNEPIVVINGKTELCSGESSVLSVAGDFAEYFWNSGETTKSITVSQTGTYSVEVTDTNGCKGTACIDVKAIVISLDGLTDTDFGRISVDNKDNKTLILTNTSNESIRIENVRLKSGNSELSITTIPQAPAVLDSGETMTISIDFEPNLIQEYSDSLIIEITEPCDETLEASVKGIGTGKMLVWLPDVSKEVGHNICIPLYAKLENTKPITFDSKFNAEFRYNATALMPQRNYSIIGNDRVIDFNNLDLTVGKDTSKIAELCGTVLLAENNTTSLILSNFTLSNPCCDIETKDGSLTILGCVIEISRIILANDFELRMYPNPVKEESKIIVRSKQKTYLSIQLINNLGIKIADIFSGFIDVGEHTIQFSPDSNLASGTYWIRIIINQTEQIIKPILIIN